jgi:hypothetical protein
MKPIKLTEQQARLLKEFIGIHSESTFINEMEKGHKAHLATAENFTVLEHLYYQLEAVVEKA